MELSTDDSSPPAPVGLHAQEDRFKASFKRFKGSCSSSSSSLSESERKYIFDGDSLPEISEKFQYEMTSPVSVSDSSRASSCSSFWGLKPHSEWTILKFNFPQGLIFIRNPFTAEGQRYWISKCVYDYPYVESHITNIQNLERRQNSTVTTTMGTDSTKYPGGGTKADFYKKLRWITFGYHHDWDTKIYSEDLKCTFPEDLADLTKYLALVLGFDKFNAEAAIVNYYNMDSTLSGHQDRSEANQDAPLFSISFGQSAIFLIGGESKEIEPLPIYLKSGDIVVMSGKSRLSYHGVPKIVPNISLTLPWIDLSSNNNSVDISLNAPESKKRKTASQENFNGSKMSDNVSFSQQFNRPLFDNVLSNWDNFLTDYSARCRVNLNVRQVLFPGQSSLT